MKYSVVIPAFNEQDVLTMSYERIKTVMDTLGDYELIFVNDGSRDGTQGILKSMAAADSSVKVLSFSRNFGHQEAVSAGMAAACGDAVIIIDCDLQDPPEVIPDMVKKWQAGADIVYGQRTRRKGETAFKKLTDMKWDIYPEGIYHVIKEAYKKYTLPIVITENGIADAVDNKRPSYLRDHLFFIAKAIYEGVPVKGYYHWSLLDNFEWAHGFKPRFGLIAVDFETQQRNLRYSALLYRDIIHMGCL